jgi:Arc/MetJ-type ribon-helix-helix transcriptional regulator
VVKSTVRFPDAVMEQVEEMVDRGVFSSKSEFQRFAVELVLSEMGTYEPEMVDFEELKTEAFPVGQSVRDSVPPCEESETFYEDAARVRQFAIRGEIDIAEEYIDTTYPVTDPRCLLLDDLLETYRQRRESE